MGDLDEIVAWLRQQISGDLTAAQIIGAGGFEPQRWDTEPPGLVNPPSIRARAQINVALLPDPEDRLMRECLPGWVQIVSYDRMLGEPPERDCRDDDLPVALVADGRREFDHIIRHDPRNVVADCEAKLAILGRYARQAAKYGENCMEEDRIWVLEPVVRLLASGYRHREGFKEEWLP